MTLPSSRPEPHLPLWVRIVRRLPTWPVRYATVIAVGLPLGVSARSGFAGTIGGFAAAVIVREASRHAIARFVAQVEGRHGLDGDAGARRGEARR